MRVSPRWVWSSYRYHGDRDRQVRGDPRQVAIVPEHVVRDLERIVSENDRFPVVAKRQGTPADVAMEETRLRA